MAAKHNAVTRTIAAEPATVWALLTDASTYEAWNPTVIDIEGPIVEGNTIKLTSTLSPKRAFKLKVSDMQAPTRMVWSDGMPLGLFKGVRTYTIAELDEGCEFSMVEEFSGPLSGLICKSIPDLAESFDQIADGLKAAAEGQSSRTS